jgi:hypothetical protein
VIPVPAVLPGQVITRRECPNCDVTDPPGWLVFGPDGDVIAAGPQTEAGATADAGEED